MTLAVRTLARSDDLLGFGPRNIMKLQDGRRILRLDRGQMGVVVEIELIDNFRPRPFANDRHVVVDFFDQLQCANERTNLGWESLLGADRPASDA